jgi:hypothetical protein
VRTASVRQVRQPLYASSVGRWKRYERALGPLFEKLSAKSEAAASPSVPLSARKKWNVVRLPHERNLLAERADAVLSERS